ncbi:MAG: hypothetical protein SPI19_03710 [Peptoniphilaceae bacterium]|nr:hypothetical protein [Peptoniphilaceae bacterium]
MEQIDDEILNEAYPGGGRSAYHPKMMLKVIHYAYTQDVQKLKDRVTFT